MKKIAIIAIALLAIFGVYSLFNQQKPIIRTADYSAYMTPDHLQKAEKAVAEHISFWEKKLDEQPENFVYQSKLASQYSAWFKLTGEVEKLYQADSILQLVNERYPNRVGTLQALSANAITRHSFAEAEGLMRQALALGERKHASSLMLTDVLLERGNFTDASILMRDLDARSQFDYLIREMKMLDQTGHLPEAIEKMENALALARKSGSKELLNWALSNLADMYGHDGRIQLSYDTYLEALANNPADLHSLKGIAWVAFSHDHNTAEARRILGFLQTVHPVPDYDLLLSDIAAFENKPDEAMAYRQSFIAKASNPAYGNMYKAYLCNLKASKMGQADEACTIAEHEVAERPHPMSYGLLAWAEYQKGDKAAALDIIEKHVMNQTQEPKAIYHTGVILAGNGHKKEAKKYLEEALGASFELGPVAAMEIKEDLKRL
ncbi:MAG: cell surface protein [Bacteroidetes bacterium]|nr:cell surface protein [Bacteroidota bacterium]